MKKLDQIRQESKEIKDKWFGGKKKDFGNSSLQNIVSQ